jgi:Sensors of blue-light using FAD
MGQYFLINMAPLFEILYKSESVSSSVVTVELENILKTSRLNNSKRNITGMLMYFRGEFIQLLEGDQEQVLKVFSTAIKNDTRHSNVRLIAEGPIVHRSFSDWSMGFVGDEAIQSRVTVSTSALMMDLLSQEAKKSPQTPGVTHFVKTYNQMRRFPSR